MFMSLGRILTVDDQIEDLEIINHMLEREDFEIISAKNGKEALDILGHQKNIDVIVLDKMMPVMDGISFLRRLRERDEFMFTPVIMQSAADDEMDVMQGIDAGVYWYITKPFSADVLCTLVRSAMRVQKKHNKMRQITDFYVQRRKVMKSGMEKLKNCVFEVQTLQDAKDVSTAVSCSFPNPKEIIGAAQELLVNAVEHGNLGISFDEKSRMVMDGTWEDEIEYRQSLAENARKKVTATINRSEKFITLTIKDDGKGFDPEPYLLMDKTRMHKANGRGIYLASLAFDKVEFVGSGNEVVCYKYF